MPTLRYGFAAVALAGLVAAAPIMGTAGGGSAAAAAACSVTYEVNQWTGGFTADVTVVNGGSALASWAVTWTFDSGQQVTSAWNAQVTQTGRTVSAVNESYNGFVAVGGTIDFGFQGTWAGSNDTPTDFAVNGVSCEGAATATPTPTVTATPTAAPTGTATSPAGCAAAGVVFCDGFESQTGTVPSGRWSVYNLNCAGTGTAAIDSTTAHSAGKSAKVVGFDGYCNHVFIRDTADMGLVGPVWDVRFWVMHTTPLPTGHVTFVAMNDANAGNTDLRFGGQNGALMWNRQSDDQTLPDQSPAGVAQSSALPVNSWNCVEFQVDGSTGAVTTWLNGTEVAGLSESGTPVANVSDQWLAGNGAQWRPSLTDLKFGWESYGGGGDDTLWFDDIALSSGRIGC